MSHSGSRLSQQSCHPIQSCQASGFSLAPHLGADHCQHLPCVMRLPISWQLQEGTIGCLCLLHSRTLLIIFSITRIQIAAIPSASEILASLLPMTMLKNVLKAQQTVRFLYPSKQALGLLYTYIDLHLLRYPCNCILDQEYNQ